MDDDRRRFSQLAHIWLIGELIEVKRPQRVIFRLLIDEVDLTLQRTEGSPGFVGDMEHVKGGIEGYSFLPSAAAAAVVGMLASGKVDRFYAYGSKVHPRRTRIKGYTLRSSSPSDDVD